ncbi:MAG TPA: hypothetical protein VMA37_10250 [Acetobacteraceae bacterium]|nr:hypothetical protein [Acetobacteraceae bacterium]
MLNANISEMAIGDSGTISMTRTAETITGAAARDARLMFGTGDRPSTARADISNRAQIPEDMPGVADLNRKHQRTSKSDDQENPDGLGHEGDCRLANLRGRLKNGACDPESKANGK